MGIDLKKKWGLQSQRVAIIKRWQWRVLKKSYVWIRTISPFSVACCLISNFLHRAFQFGLHLIQQCTKRCVVRSFEFYGTFFVRMYLITKKSHNFIFYLLKSAWITTKPQYVTGTDKFASALQLLLFFMEHRLIILSLELSSWFEQHLSL